MVTTLYFFFKSGQDLDADVQKDQRSGLMNQKKVDPVNFEDMDGFCDKNWQNPVKDVSIYLIFSLYLETKQILNYIKPAFCLLNENLLSTPFTYSNLHL